MKDPCSSVSELLEKYFDREATDRERALVEAHLPGCSSCQDALGSMEQLSTLIRVPPEACAREEDFDRLWLRVKRETRPEEKPSSWEVFRAWLGITSLLQKRVWIPVVSAVIVLIFLTAPLLLKKSPSLPGQFGVEYVESTTNNVMVYEVEKSKVTVIWLFEGPETEPTTS